jgi:hydrogenase maturation protein HypF
MREVGLSARLKIIVRGAVQGVGFRPFIYRLATGAGLKGWVNNSAQGVFLEVEGPRADLEAFLLRLEAEKPPRSSIQSLEASWLDPVGYPAFEIRPSEAGGPKTALVLPDIATCPDCLGEVFDPCNRRYGYPFTNCTNCGPRFSIIESLPYDRANTSMKAFTMCPQCQAEYNDPRDRRFHAQPNACPVCGPQLELWDRKGRGLPSDEPRSFERSRGAIVAATDAIRQGQIVAVKGLGGFHLMVAAHNDEAVRRLRELKHREEKPFALMFPSLPAIKAACEVSPLEERLLRSPEAPIVLLRRRQSAIGNRQLAIGNRQSAIGNRQLAIGNRQLAMSLAPANPNLGAMLPYTPLHHLLLSALGFPVIATSGNLSDEPICTDEHEALERLGGIADLFLVHNRSIVRHVDDSIVRVMMGRELVLRRARGYAPLPIQLTSSIGNRQSALGNTVLAVGAHLKNTITLAVGSQAFISQHIGDLEIDQANAAFRRVITDFQNLYESRPSIIATDAHPDYLSTKFARDLVAQASLPASDAGIPARIPPLPRPQLLSVQHHIAHVLSCMAENELDPPVLGVSWDGTGYGLDGTVWGGEFFLVTEMSCQRVAHLRQFRLPGGDRAVKEPRRTALGLLYEMFGEAAFAMADVAPVRAFSPAELGLLKTMLARSLNSPLTSSVGRLFDAAASLAGLRQQVRFEGQAAMDLEFALEGTATAEAYDFPIRSGHAPRSTLPAPLLLDWSPMVEAILADLKRRVPIAQISARFHNALAEAIVAVAKRVGQPRVVLSGGCFQNRYLTERSVQRLQEEGFRPYWHQRVPPNDGGISLGQVVAALRQTPVRNG